MSPTRVLSRKRLTDTCLQQLRDTGFPIGDAGPPENGSNDRQAGWNGQPGVPGSTYIPYAVLTPSTITAISGPMGDSSADAQVPYQLSVFGINRGQVENLADRCRVALGALAKTNLELAGITYRIQQLRWTVGGIGRIDSADPPTYGEVDSFVVWLSQ